MKPNSDKNTEPMTGEIWWLNNLKFDDDAGMKSRPVVIVSCDGDNVRIRICTTVSNGYKERVELLDPIYAGLDNKNSYVICEIITVARQKLVRKMGMLCDEYLDNLGLQ